MALRFTAARPLSRWRGWRRHLLLLALVLVSGCTSLGYYAHVARGEASVLAHRRAIGKLIANPSTAPALARRLRLAQQARRFASTQLRLPDNRSYTTYVQLDRAYVAWNVFAAPRYGVQAVPQCFPIAGCVAYRGYFDHARAQRASARLRKHGYDVWMGGVPAFSTLGWFADPILSSMLRWDDDELASTIFHELAHQLIYVKGDTAFNESYATFVQREGLRQWRASRGLPPLDPKLQALDKGFTALVLDLRQRLAHAYAQTRDVKQLQAAKREQIEAFRQRFARWRDAHQPDAAAYDAWVNAPINNARLLPFGLYDQWTPAFAQLFEQSGQNWPRFYDRVRSLGKLPEEARHAEIDRLLSSARRRDGD